MKSKTKDMAIFAMLGCIMFLSKIIMEFLPNIHLVGMFLIVFTLVYRVKALIPLYVFVLLQIIYAGFNPWTLPYLYIWLPVWGAVMLLPKDIIEKKHSVLIFMAIGGVFGLIYGTLYSPAWALMFGLDFNGTAAWIISGLPYDIIHAVGNVCTSFLILPLYKVLSRLAKG